jgi:dienelactone hydrolase
MTLEDFSESTFTHDGTTRPVYRRGTGPGVLVMHEIPGITPEVARFARIVADRGFTVSMPHLFGIPGKPMSTAYAVTEIARVCIRREVYALASRETSPLAEWLRAHCRAFHQEIGGKGVGVIGMCITGNFALALMVDEWVMAPVLSQPSLPAPIGRERRRGLHLSDEDLTKVKARTLAGAVVLGMRFTGDPMVPKERFERLREELGCGFEGIEIDSSPGNKHGIGRGAHSVVTTDLVDREGHPTKQALERVLSFFEERLKP